MDKVIPIPERDPPRSRAPDLAGSLFDSPGQAVGDHQIRGELYVWLENARRQIGDKRAFEHLIAMAKELCLNSNSAAWSEATTATYPTATTTQPMSGEDR